MKKNELNVRGRGTVSIIIPHYNSSSLLEKLFLSIPDREEIEILVIDDNSTNIEFCKLERLAHFERACCYFYKNDSSVNSAGSCRNIGLKHSTGEWLLFADADDYFADSMWEKLEPYLQQEYDIIYFKPFSENLKTGKPADRHIRACNLIDEYCCNNNEVNETKLRYLWEAPWSKLFRRRIVDENKILFDSTRVANDIMFSMRAAKAAGNITASSDTIYVITKSDNSLTVTLTKENFYTRLNVVIDKYHFLKKNLTPKEWKTVDMTGRPCVRMAKQYGLCRGEIIRLYFLFCREGIRPAISRKWTPAYIIHKIFQKLTDKNN